MPINNQIGALFVHIPKTGGTSIEKILGMYHEQWMHPDIDKYHGFFPVKRKYIHNPLALDNLNGYYLQHLTLNEIYELSNNQKSKSLFKFTFVRNPWDRLVSEYVWKYQHLNFDKYIYKVQEVVKNRILLETNNIHFRPQVEFINEDIDYIGRFENFQNDVKKIIHQFKLEPNTFIPHEKKSHKTHYAKYFTEETSEIVKKIYSEDIDQFDYKISTRNVAIFTQSKPVTEIKIDFSYTNRIVEDLKNFKCKNELILTSYFTSKPNPQLGVLSNRLDPNSVVTETLLNSTSLTKPLFQSITDLNLNLIVFHDELSEELILQNQNKNIRFIKVRLGDYSTNDERYFIYYEFIRQINVKSIFMIDCFDVVCIKPPFALLSENPHKLFIGRDSCYSIANSEYLINKLSLIIKNIFIKQPPGYFDNFLQMPLFNAGIIGGNTENILPFLKKVCGVMTDVDNDLNNNMCVINYVIYIMYMSQYYFGKSKLIDYDPANDQYGKTQYVYSGYPLNSHFKKYENRKDVYFKHK
jgi:hypothetical protein